MPETAYFARILEAEEANSAFPLASLAHPLLTLDAWRKFVRRINRGPRGRQGLVAIVDRRRLVHALFSYQLEWPLGSHGHLRIADLVVGHLPGAGVATAVLIAIERLALETESLAVAVDVTEACLSMTQRKIFDSAGFRLGAVRLLRATPAAPGQLLASPALLPAASPPDRRSLAPETGR